MNTGAKHTLGELIEAVAKQIYYYNNDRIHTALRCPPAVFAKRLNCQKFNSQKPYCQNNLNFQVVAKGMSV